MKINKRYYKNVKRLFPVYARKEREYLSQLKEQIEEYDAVSYDELVSMVLCQEKVPVKLRISLL